jgi:hypothetical protein
VHTLVKMMLVYVVESTVLRASNEAGTAGPAPAKRGAGAGAAAAIFCAGDVLPTAASPAGFLALAGPADWPDGVPAVPLSSSAPTNASTGTWTPPPPPAGLPNASWAHATDELGLVALATPSKVRPTPPRDSRAYMPCRRIGTGRGCPACY